MRRFALIAPLTLLAADALADTRLYRCEDPKGRAIFSDEPCGPSAEIVELEIHRPSAAQRREAQRRAAEAIAITDEIMRQRTRQCALARAAEIRFHEERRLQAERKKAEQAAKPQRESTESTHTIVSNRRRPPPPTPPMERPPKKQMDLNRPRPPRSAQGLRPSRPDPDALKPPPHRPPKPRSPRPPE